MKHSFGMSWTADTGLDNLKIITYFISHPIKTYKMKQVRERWEGKGSILLPVYNPDSHQQKT